MKIYLSGQIQSLRCNKNVFPVYPGKVMIFHPPRLSATELSRATQASDRLSMRIVTEEELAGMQDRFIAESPLDKEGNYRIEASGDNLLGPVEMVVVVESPVKDEDKKSPAQVAVSFGLKQPDWRTKNQEIFYAQISLLFDATWWCRLLEMLDLYMVCGTVYQPDCETPLAGVRVQAFDKDVFVDDYLGETFTNDHGRYCILYPESLFRETIISWLKAEVIGPDYYFKVDDPNQTGLVLLDEAPSIGRNPGRGNSPRCHCVDLCVKEEIPPATTPPPHFTHVGSYKIFAPASDINVDGYAMDGGHELAFTGNLPLRGIKPEGNSLLGWEYRFRWEEVGGPGSGIVNLASMGAIVIGDLSYVSGMNFVTEEFWLNKPTATWNVMPDAQGWVKVPRNNNLYDPAEGFFVSNKNLANLISSKLVLETPATNPAFDLADAPVYQVGTPIPAAVQTGIHTFRIIFEARPVGFPAPTVSDVMEKMVISNLQIKQERHPYWNHNTPTLPGVCMLGITELEAGGCQPVKNQIEVKYSAFHPHLRNVKVWLEGGSISPATFTFTPAVAPNGEATGANVLDISALPPCSYLLRMRTIANLTNGYGLVASADQYDYIGFCKR